MNILLTQKDGNILNYPIGNLPFDNDELRQRVAAYYGDKDCDRCRNAVLGSGLSRLIVEIEDRDISDNTMKLFPILENCVDILINR